MGKNPCRLCFTPGVTIKDGHQTCLGCGVTCLYDMSLYFRREHLRVTFDFATRKYEAARSCETFGSWLMGRNYELIARA